MAKNRFDLGRNIPSDVRKRVRRRCGFGCVLCGSPIVTYEHFDPPFRDAKAHRAEGITLLCGSHQLESSKGLLSRDSIAAANSKPCCTQRGYAASVLDLGRQRPKLLVGGSDFTNCGSGVAFNGKWLLRVRAPEPHSTRWQLSAQFFSEAGELACEIRNNELIIPALSFEIEQVARTLTVRREKKVLLALELMTENGDLAINSYIVTTAGGEVFIGLRSIRDPLTSIESLKSVIEFQNVSGATTTIVNCRFETDVGLNLCLSDGKIVMRSQLV